MDSDKKMFLSLKKIAFTIIVFFCLSLCNSAMGRKLDSLLAYLNDRSFNDTTQVNLLIKIAGIYYNIDADSAILYANRGVALAEKIHFEKGKANCMQQLGFAFLHKDEYNKALKNFQDALNIYQKTGNKKGESFALLEIGDVYATLAKNDLSLEYFNKSLQISRQVKDVKEVGRTYEKISYIYSDLGNYSEALNYALKGLNALEKVNDKPNISNTLTHIATIYAEQGDSLNAIDYINKSLAFQTKEDNIHSKLVNLVNIGMVYGQLNYNNQSLNIFKKALHISDSIGDHYYKNICLTYIAETYYEMGDFNNAFIKYKDCLKEAEKLKDMDGIASANSAIGEILIKRGKISEGIAHLQKALEIMKKNGLKQKIFETAGSLYKAYKQAHSYQHALEYHELYSNYKDSLFNEKNNKRTRQLLSDLDLSKKESKIQLLEKNKLIEQGRNEKKSLIIWAIISGLALLIIIIILPYRYSTNKKRNHEKILKKNHEIQLQAAKLEELNRFKDKTFSLLSHDLRGPLDSFTTIMKLLDEKTISINEFSELKPEVNKQLNSLNILFDNLLNWAKTYVKGKLTAKPEITNLYNIAAQNIRLLLDAANEKQITIYNYIPPAIHAWCDQEQMDIVIRNLLMNAIKFTNQKGTVTLSATGDANIVELYVTDNGVGMTQEQLDKLFTSSPDNNTYGTDGEKGAGLGLLLCHTLIKANNGSISAASVIGKGSRFTIELPVPDADTQQPA